jgi:hypothetical protein
MLGAGLSYYKKIDTVVATETQTPINGPLVAA